MTRQPLRAIGEPENSDLGDLSCKETEKRLKLFRRVAEDLSADADLARVVATVAELVTEATAADVCFVHLVDAPRRGLTLAGATPPFDDLIGTIELAWGEGIAGWVAAHGEPAVVADKWSDPRYRYIPALRGEEFKALVSVPMLRRGTTVVGVLNVHWRQAREVMPSEVEVLVDVANLLAGAVENTLLYRRLSEREATVAQFAGRTIEAQESERRRLAMDIHDGIGQRLVSLSYHLDAAMAANPDEPQQVHQELVRAMQLARFAMSETRDAIEDLRPGVLDDLGLGAGLESLARDLLEADVRVEGFNDISALGQHVQTTLYRIGQEALRNVKRHAQASQVWIELVRLDGSVALTVADDGVGMEVGPPARGHYGIIGMAERAELAGGTLEIFSAPGKGTKLTALVPLEESPESPMKSSKRSGKK